MLEQINYTCELHHPYLILQDENGEMNM